MNKKDLKKLALLGISGGFLFTAQSQANVDLNSTSFDGGPLIAQNGCGGPGGCGGVKNGNDKKNNNNMNNGTKKNFHSHLPQNNEMTSSNDMKDQPMSERDLWAELDNEGRTMYQNLSPEGKALARKLAGQSCQGHNDCKGLNACRTEKNGCAGKGGCKGQSKCNFKDKNKAVKVASMHMANKRNGLQDQMNNGNMRFHNNDGDEMQESSSRMENLKNLRNRHLNRNR